MSDGIASRLQSSNWIPCPVGNFKTQPVIVIRGLTFSKLYGPRIHPTLLLADEFNVKYHQKGATVDPLSINCTLKLVFESCEKAADVRMKYLDGLGDDFPQITIKGPNLRSRRSSTPSEAPSCLESPQSDFDISSAIDIDDDVKRTMNVILDQICHNDVLKYDRDDLISLCPSSSGPMPQRILEASYRIPDRNFLRRKPSNNPLLDLISQTAPVKNVSSLLTIGVNDRSQKPHRLTSSFEAEEQITFARSNGEHPDQYSSYFKHEDRWSHCDRADEFVENNYRAASFGSMRGFSEDGERRHIEDDWNKGKWSSDVNDELYNNYSQISDRKSSLPSMRPMSDIENEQQTFLPPVGRGRASRIYNNAQPPAQPKPLFGSRRYKDKLGDDNQNDTQNFVLRATNGGIVGMPQKLVSTEIDCQSRFGSEYPKPKMPMNNVTSFDDHDGRSRQSSESNQSDIDLCAGGEPAMQVRGFGRGQQKPRKPSSTKPRKPGGLATKAVSATTNAFTKPSQPDTRTVLQKSVIGTTLSNDDSSVGRAIDHQQGHVDEDNDAFQDIDLPEMPNFFPVKTDGDTVMVEKDLPKPLSIKTLRRPILSTLSEVQSPVSGSSEHENGITTTLQPAAIRRLSSGQRGAIFDEVDSWFYIDPNGQEQGPFNSSQMKIWYQGGYFSPELSVKRVGSDGDYFVLGQLMNMHGKVPFCG